MANLNNKIEVYQQNTREISCLVIGVSDITGWIPYLTVKKNTSGDIILSKTGVVSDASGTSLFSLTSTDTSILAGDYVYDVVIENGEIKYTVVKDRFSVLDGVRY
jgi:hypothetical protein